MTNSCASPGSFTEPVRWKTALLYEPMAPANKCTKVTDPSGSTSYAYDALGRVTSKVQSVIANPANVSFTVGYSYANGRQTGITYPSGRAVAYTFDAGGHVASISVGGVPVLASVGYFPFGGASGWTWGNGEPYSRNYDLDGRVKAITLGPSAGLYADLSQAFGYDSLNRLVTASLAAGQAQTFSYDANGNRTNATVNAASTTYTYPTTSHRLSSLSGATTRSFAYDNAGNLTSSAGIAYVYDGRGRMKQAGTTTYAVNGLGQRVKKNNGSDIFFAYDEAGHLIGEYDASGAAIEETVWLGDMPVAVLKPNATSFDVFYIWTDNLGTPRLITDTANQSRWEWANTDPFGNNLPNEDPAGLGTFEYNLRFPGQYYDAEKGSNYNYFRDYDPSIGRYVESDPLGLPGGLNTYSYVGGNSLRYIDPYGLTCQSNWNFFWDWWFERGAQTRKYGSSSVENKEMQNSHPANYMRSVFKAGGCKNISQAGYSTMRAYFETFTSPCSTEFQVGGFIWSAQNVGKCNVKYTVKNQASLYSFFFHIPGIPHKPRGGSFGFGGNIDQVFEWIEPSPCAQCCNGGAQ